MSGPLVVNDASCAAFFPGRGGDVSLWKPCPADCPVRMHLPRAGCEFTCVNGSLGSCSNPAMNVADLEREICRSCEISGCQQCSADGSCSSCAAGFFLTEDRQECHSWFAINFPFLYALLGLVFFLLTSWYVWLRMQPVVNVRVLTRAIMRRQHVNLRDHTTEQHLWYPLSTNLCRARSDGHIPGGRALLMFFTFQAFVLLWVLGATSAWLLCAWVSNTSLLSEGKVSGVKEDIFSICHSSLNALWAGQRRSTKVGKLAYTFALYFFTVMATLTYAVLQNRRRIRLDSEEVTMKDFALMLKGFPCESGKDVEAQRCDFVRRTTGCHPIGVSICWAYDQKEVQELTARETWLWGKVRDSCGDVRATTVAEPPPRGCGLLRSYFQLVTHLLAPAAQPEADGKRHHEERARAVAHEATSTGFMYVVFRLETERHHARSVFTSETEVPLYKGHRIRHEVEGSGNEPETVLWHNFKREEQGVHRRLIASIFGIMLAILLWGLLFYFPFAIYEAWSYSALGAPADSASETTFSMVVIVGNQILYLLCAKASRYIGFRFVSHQLTAYIGLYTMALLSNLLIDLAILFYTTRMAMENVGLEVSREAFLRGTDEIGSFPVRARMGARLMAYNFPACFLLPFLCEALFTVILPFHIYQKLVGTQQISQRVADARLMPPEFDMSRYADVVLNMTQATISLVFSAGYVLPTLLGMLVGHSFVYAWDHYRVLRHVRNFRFTSFRTEKAAQRMLALPGASLIAGAMLQMFQAGAVTPSSEVVALLTMIGAFVAHVALHLLVLEYLVPWLGHAEHLASRRSYQQVAKQNPGNWFNMNPIHCLRSRYLHQHDPPCIFYQIGKEHLLEPNPKIGLFYSAPQWNNEKPSTYTELTELARKSLAIAMVPLAEQLPSGSWTKELQRFVPQSSIVKQPAALEEGDRSKEPEESATSVPDSPAAGAAEKPRKSFVTFACAASDED